MRNHLTRCAKIHPPTLFMIAAVVSVLTGSVYVFTAYRFPDSMMFNLSMSLTFFAVAVVFFLLGRTSRQCGA